MRNRKLKEKSESMKSKGNWFVCFQAAFMLLWLRNLSRTDAYFSVYVLCGAMGGYCLLKNREEKPRLTRSAAAGALVLACLFAGATVAANYPIFEMIRDVKTVSPGSNRVMNLLETLGSLLGGGFLSWQVLTYFAGRHDAEVKRVSGRNPRAVFLVFAGIIAVIDFIYLFFVVYPGNISHDSLAQIYQTVSGYYNNTFPYWLTRTIGFWMKAGYRLFGSANAAAATYNAVQILFVAGCFGYAMMTLYQIRVSRGLCATSGLIFACMPYNIAFSASMWKDVPFAVGMLLMLTAMLRLMKDLHRWPDLAAFLVGGIVVCTSRTNGVYVAGVSLLILAVPLWKSHRKLLLPWVGLLVIGWLLNGPVLSQLHVQELDDVEVLSVPLQQVGRVLVNSGDVSQEDLELLDHIMNVSEVPEVYSEWTADPMKDQVKIKGRDYLQAHMKEYAQLWLQAHPEPQSGPGGGYFPPAGKAGWPCCWRRGPCRCCRWQ